MILYNTLTEKKEEIKKPARGYLKMFVCGPTVYDYPHIGNARTYVTFDAFVKFLRSQKIKIFYLQNITDVDDKIIARAKDLGVSSEKVARDFEKIYHRNERALGITSVNKYARATGYIKEIIRQIQTLINGGYAYKIDGDSPHGEAGPLHSEAGGYYYDISKFADYGKLAKRTAASAEDGVSRIDEGINKKNKGDFALWKFQKSADEPAWDTPLGRGRPGWHIEDTAISEYFFGPQYDIHGGAVDLKFPHHEAEIAQQEAASGKVPFVNIWMHAGFLLVNETKMSKSLGNFITIDEFLKRHSALAFRHLVLSHHYLSPINYTEAAIAQAESAVLRLREFLTKLNHIRKHGIRKNPNQSIESDIRNMEAAFLEALNDDFNTPEALAAIFSFANSCQTKLWFITRSEAKLTSKTITKLLGALGMEISVKRISLKVKWLIMRREAARRKKDFSASDVLRDKIEKSGYKIEDTPLGPLAL